MSHTTQEKPFTYATVCSGVEGCSLALQGMNWKPVFFSEIEPFPSAVLSYHYPHVPNLGDMTQITYDATKGIITNGSTSISFTDRLDLLAGGTPCFTAGTMVLTPSGYRPIEDLKIGDDVVSGEGRIRKVTDVGSKLAEVGTLNVIGRPSITCTPNHPFMCVENKRDYRRKSETYGRNICVGDFKKVRADEAVGKRVGRICLANLEDFPTVSFPKCYSASYDEIAELAGWYLGDGYIRRWKDKSKKAVIFALVSQKKIETFKAHFGSSINYTVNADGKVTVCCTELANWLSENFGEGAANKRIPYWCYASEYSSLITKGYSLTDGYHCPSNVSYTTVSKALAYGIADLYYTASVSLCQVKPTTTIEGRTVNQRPQYIVRNYNNAYARLHQNRYTSKVRSWTPTNGLVRVYNLTVDVDHTYIAEGLYTHNCQDLSVAGKRAGAAEGSGTRSSLIWHFVRLIEELRPRSFLWENVVGTFSSNNGRDFSTFVAKINELGYSATWRVLDAQYTRTYSTSSGAPSWPLAIPQRRRRVWLVGCPSTDDSGLEEILFEPKSLVGNTPPRRRTREEAARIVKGGYPSNAQMVGNAAGMTFDATFGFPILPQASQTLKNGSCPGWQNGVVEECVALDGDKLKPRIDQHKGGNGFGINEENVGYTLTVPDRHGVAYGMNPQGGDMHPFHEECGETLACGHQGGVALENPISFCSRQTAVSGEGACGENFDITQTASQYKEPHGVAIPIVTNSNGGDVMPTISANAEKCGGDNQTIFGGGISSMNFEMYDTADDHCVSLNAVRACDTFVYPNTEIPNEPNSNKQ